MRAKELSDNSISEITPDDNSLIPVFNQSTGTTGKTTLARIKNWIKSITLSTIDTSEAGKNMPVNSVAVDGALANYPILTEGKLTESLTIPANSTADVYYHLITLDLHLKKPLFNLLGE